MQKVDENIFITEGIFLNCDFNIDDNRLSGKVVFGGQRT